MNLNKVSFCLILIYINSYKCEQYVAPDPWNLENSELSEKIRNDDVPPDLKLSLKPKIQTVKNVGVGEWFFKRMLAIIMKGGQIQNSDDKSIDVTMKMRFDLERWETLNGYILSDSALTEEMFRRSVGYIEEAIYKPTIKDKIVMAWSDYIQLYLMEYKMHITWTLGISGLIIALIWLWNHMSHTHMLIIIFIALYIYEVLISYKEAEKKEVDNFLSAVNTCKWYFWTSSCEIPSPDPIIFLKHMNPLKIGIRMFTTLISEPMITISASIKIIVSDITAGLWSPFKEIVHGILVVTFNAILIFLLVMIIFNYILNIPFRLSFLAGLISIGMESRKRTITTNSDNNSNRVPGADNENRISGATLDRLLDVFSHALTNSQNSRLNTRTDVFSHAITSSQNSGFNTRTHTKNSTMRRSASTGRLSNICSLSDGNNKTLTEESNTRRRNVTSSDGSGDAH